jgi:phage terminase small subunit
MKNSKTLCDEYSIDDVAGLKILQVTCEAYDRAQKARDEIDKNGMTVLDKFGQVKPSPLLATERDSRAGFLAGLKALRLDLDPLENRPGRPNSK